MPLIKGRRSSVPPGIGSLFVTESSGRSGTRSSARGRPVVTSHAEIERVAFELFAAQGFAGTTMADIARTLGVGTRTLFRYYASKNDIPWGQFDQTLINFKALLDSQPSHAPVHEAVHRA